MTRRGATALAALLAAGILPSAAHGQSVRGVVSRADADSPVTGAFVEVLGSSGNRVVAGLTDEGGRYRLDSGPGVTLVITYVGFSEFRTTLAPNAPDQVTFIDVALEPSPIALEGISVVTEDRCGTDLLDYEIVGRAWTEATRVLASADWANEAGTFRYDVELFERRLDREARKVEAEGRRVVPAAGRHPFRSPDPEQLARDGYVREANGRRTYYAPDVDVLLSDSFLDTHCFGIIRGDEDHPNQLGLTFRPLDGRSRPDIAGTFWLDLATSELRTVDFRYEGLGRDIETSRLGGTVEFDRVEGGGWVVSSWTIRTPAIGLQPVAGTTRRREVLIGVHEDGGQLRRVRHFGRTVDVASELGRVRGRIVEEESFRPLGGAVARLTGTSMEAIADANGLFEFRDVRPGVYELAIDHADVYTADGGAFSVSVESTEATNLPSLPIQVATLWSNAIRSCVVFGEDLEDRHTALTGTVVDDVTGTALPRVSVAASWLDVNRIDATGFEGRRIFTETETDGAGGFTLCNVPTRTEVTLFATALGVEGEPVRVRMEEGEVGTARVSVPLQTGVALTGEVRDATTGQAIESVRIVVGRVSVLSDEEGRFHIESIAPGRQGFEVGHIAYGLNTDTIDIAASGSTHVDVLLAPEAVELDPIEVSVVSAAEAEARRSGTRVDFLDATQLEELSLGARDVADVLLHANVPGLWVYRASWAVHPSNPNQTRLGICVQYMRTNATNDCQLPEVYLDGLRLVDPQFTLLDIQPLALRRVEFLSRVAAQARYPDARYGVLLLFTR
ncbi:MAG: carboxypeptidase regulatory-like domain-containing protein [Gemmatimonadota bacterium]